MKAKDFRSEFFQYLRQAYGAPALVQMQALPPMRVQGRYPAFQPSLMSAPLQPQGNFMLPGMVQPMNPQFIAPGVTRETTQDEQVRAINEAAPMLSRMG